VDYVRFGHEKRLVTRRVSRQEHARPVRHAIRERSGHCCFARIAAGSRDTEARSRKDGRSAPLGVLLIDESESEVGAYDVPADAWSSSTPGRLGPDHPRCSRADEESRAKNGGGAKPVSQVLRLSVETAPGVVKFDKERLSAKAGRIAFELTNDKRKGHNIRIHTGDTCCFRPGSRDIGGTRTIGTGRTRVSST
jgi:hypothetical protein